MDSGDFSFVKTGVVAQSESDSVNFLAELNRTVEAQFDARKLLVANEQHDSQIEFFLTGKTKSRIIFVAYFGTTIIIEKNTNHVAFG